MLLVAEFVLVYFQTPKKQKYVVVFKARLVYVYGQRFQSG